MDSIFKKLLHQLFEVFGRSMKPSAHERLIFLTGVCFAWRLLQQLSEDEKSGKSTYRIVREFDIEVNEFIEDELPKFHKLYCKTCQEGGVHE